MEENFVRKVTSYIQIFYEVLPVFEWMNNSVAQNVLPSKETHGLTPSLVTAQPLRQT